jgi:hypothetical protein
LKIFRPRVPGEFADTTEVSADAARIVVAMEDFILGMFVWKAAPSGEAGYLLYQRQELLERKNEWADVYDYCGFGERCIGEERGRGGRGEKRR